MSPVIDEEELERIRSDSPEQLKKRNWQTSEARIERVDAAVKEYGFKSSNKLIDRAIDWYLEALREAKEKKGAKPNGKR